MITISPRRHLSATGLLASQQKIAYYACNRLMLDRDTGAFAKGDKVRGLYSAMLSSAIERCEARVRRCQQEIRAQKEKIASLQKNPSLVTRKEA